MYKLVLFLLLSVFLMTLHAKQFDEEIAMNSLFQAKYALNRAVHAAAQQLDTDKLARGITSINTVKAERTALQYLQKNLNLNASNMPLPNAFLRSKVEVLVFNVINENEAFPYTYTNLDYDYKVMLQRPGIIMIIRVVYPRTYSIVGPITWEIKGVSETVNF
jgi:hypothetical protein